MISRLLFNHIFLLNFEYQINFMMLTFIVHFYLFFIYLSPSFKKNISQNKY